MDIDTIVKLAQLGTSGVLLFVLIKLWDEFKAQNAFIREMLLKLQENDEKAARERKKISRAVDADIDSSTTIPVQRNKRQPP